MSRKPHIFSDSDGVLFDFELGYFNAFGHHFHAVEAGVAWKNIYRMPDFYDNLPLMPGAEEYWAMIEGLDPTVLTGAPTAGHEAACAAKRRAIARHFGAHVPVITCYSRDKPLHMKNPGDVILDDQQKNVDKWIASGGVGILYRDPHQAVGELRKVLGI